MYVEQLDGGRNSRKKSTELRAHGNPPKVGGRVQFRKRAGTPPRPQPSFALYQTKTDSVGLRFAKHLEIQLLVEYFHHSTVISKVVLLLNELGTHKLTYNAYCNVREFLRKRRAESAATDWAIWRPSM